MTVVDRRLWVPTEVNVDAPSAARVYDYLLGGSYNFAADRAFAQQAIGIHPGLPMVCRENRSFLRRAVRHCVANGITQFLDIGSGLPTSGNVHEVAPEARVVYVDNEPVAVAHSRMMLKDSDRAAIVHADLRDPETILDAPETRRLLDFDQPVGLLIVAVLHFVLDTDLVKTVLARYRDQLAPGSFLVLSHGTLEQQAPSAKAIQDLYNRSPNKVITRTKQECIELMDGFDLVEPGVVFTPLWRPEPLAEKLDRPEDAGWYGMAGRLL
ncbi:MULTISPECIES: SAM-dependent methyltransferase [unclassified Crossiella]|uniref:SAM-dependent methyltransferase n=1 Tax=unclassified Crossiella TaxID=2620835 RepID=UPI001FFFB8E8|nr:MULTISPECIES: SAM-dependent methyltransferase [unclassified Crossiella]MCK2241267.1 SAM-dependent methyltransferase [Crossiella sp. S99.2]MCK2253589.1 SAM-dependent methyltransferase [Crossiella sp. S99.1]